jgi:ABC-type transporter Mla MlaB component
MSFQGRIGQGYVGNRLINDRGRSLRRPSTVHRVALGGPVAGADLPALCERVRVLVARDPPPLVEFDLAALPRADLDTVEVLVRLQLTAKRAGCRIRVCHPPEGLGELLMLLGLDSCVAIRVEVVGQAEEREEPGGVQEEGDAADAVL